jgi:putative transcriptional regulator
MNTPLEKGTILVAVPALRDPNFRQTVILLCEYGADGALGFIVNRPTEIRLSEGIPRMPVLEGQQHVLFAGGPVATNQIMLLFRFKEKPTQTHQVFDGVYLGGDVDEVVQLLTEPRPSDSFRAYLGYAGWSAGQLEREMEAGSWVTLPADSHLVFEQPPTRMWSDVMRALGEPYAFYADMPHDPGLN